MAGVSTLGCGSLSSKPHLSQFSWPSALTDRQWPRGMTQDMVGEAPLKVIIPRGPGTVAVYLKPRVPRPRASGVSPRHTGEGHPMANVSERFSAVLYCSLSSTLAWVWVARSRVSSSITLFWSCCSAALLSVGRMRGAVLKGILKKTFQIECYTLHTVASSSSRRPH